MTQPKFGGMNPAAFDKDAVVIVLCTYNGAQHIAEQLASYEAQTHKNWSLWVSDDGSTDDTLAILQQWKIKWNGRHDVTIIQGPQDGSAKNFMSLLCHPDLPDSFVAISDQDDVWHAEKLTRALSQLRLFGQDAVALYGAQSTHTDSKLRPVGVSLHPKRPPSFGNALTQNIISGHSTVLNPNALALVREIGIPEKIPFHDWWLYQLISGVGGSVIVDNNTVLSYRQHDENVLGAHQGTLALLARLKLIFDGTYRDWIVSNLAALKAAEQYLSAETRALVDDLSRLPPGAKRARRMRKAGLHRQDRLGTALFYIAAHLGRI